MGPGLRAGVTTLILIFCSSLRAAAQTSAGDSGWFDPPVEGQGTPGRPLQTPAPSAQPSPAPRPAPAADDANPRALTDFKPHLDPYGSWRNDPQYGTVWVPHTTVVGSGFSPYVSGGRWALSNSGDWVWLSDYPFGWVVFHYGRWVWVAGHGWAWIPGYRYAPSWVAWRVPMGNYSYVGWAPLGPDYIWVDGRAVSVHWYSPYYWVFCPSPYAFHTHVSYYVVRDRGLIDRLSHSTRRYQPAQPRLRSTPASPPPSLARVPVAAVPKQRVSLTPALPRSSESRRAVVPPRARSTEAAVPVERSSSPKPAPAAIPARRSAPPAVELDRRAVPPPASLRPPARSGRVPVRDTAKFKKKRP